jgi:hypothetical protein
MEAIRSPETSVHTRSTRRHIPQDGILHHKVALEMLEVGIYSSLSSPKLTIVVQGCPNLMIVLAREDVEVHHHALKTKAEQFQLCEWEHCCLGELHHCSEIMSGSWDAPDYPTCPCTPLQ